MTMYVIRINESGLHSYWSRNVKTACGCGWRDTIDCDTRWTFAGVLWQLAVIRDTLSDMPPVTIVPVPMPTIEVCERDATALAEAIRLAIETTGSKSFKEELQDILSRLTPAKG